MKIKKLRLVSIFWTFSQRVWRSNLTVIDSYYVRASAKAGKAKRMRTKTIGHSCSLPCYINNTTHEHKHLSGRLSRGQLKMRCGSIYPTKLVPLYMYAFDRYVISMIHIMHCILWATPWCSTYYAATPIQAQYAKLCDTWNISPT